MLLTRRWTYAVSAYFVRNPKFTLIFNFLSKNLGLEQTRTIPHYQSLPLVNKVLIAMECTEAKRPKLMDEEPAVTNFREYLRYKTVEPNPDYDGAVGFLKRMAKELGLPVQCIEVHPGMPVVIITWEGTQPQLKSVILNSHIDVVPVFPEHWVCDPFEAKKMENGDIYARGSQDMKCVGIQYIEAIRRLIQGGVRLTRTIHMIFVPDEERGGLLGMKLFVQMPEFKKLNAGFGLDEGLANPTEKFKLYHGERGAWRLTVTCSGRPGHGSQFIEGTAGECLQKVITAFMNYRDEEKARLKKCSMLGEVNTLNLVKIWGGVADNVVPSELNVLFDLRVSPFTNKEEMEKKLDELVGAGGPGASYVFKMQEMSTVTTLEDNPWWKAMKDACDEERIELEVEIFPAGTDSKYFRRLGIPCLGFSPMNNTEVLLHDHNERLNEGIFLRGIDIYECIIPAVANVAGE